MSQLHNSLQVELAELKQQYPDGDFSTVEEVVRSYPRLVAQAAQTLKSIQAVEREQRRRLLEITKSSTPL